MTETCTIEVTTIETTTEGAVGEVHWVATQVEDGLHTQLPIDVRESIRRGVQDVDAGRVKPWDEVRSARVEA